MKIDITYSMNKTGITRDPNFVVLLTFLTLGVYGIIWFCKIAQELKNYRIKGAPGWFLALGILFPMAMFPASIAATYYLFEIPYAIGQERIKLNLSRGVSGRLGLLPFIALVTLIAVVILWHNSVQIFGLELFIYLAMIAVASVMVFIWIHRIQASINDIWIKAGITEEFASPINDISNKKSVEQLENIKDEEQ